MIYGGPELIHCASRKVFSAFFFFFSIVNCMEDLEFTWSSSICTLSWWSQSMKVSSTYPNHMVGFSSDISKSHLIKVFIYRFVITGDNGSPTAKPSSCWYMFNPIRSILFIPPLGYLLGPLCSPREGSNSKPLTELYWWESWWKGSQYPSSPSIMQSSLYSTDTYLLADWLHLQGICSVGDYEPQCNTVFVNFGKARCMVAYCNYRSVVCIYSSWRNLGSCSTSMRVPWSTELDPSLSCCSCHLETD